MSKYIFKTNEKEEITTIVLKGRLPLPAPYYETHEFPFKGGHKAMYNPERGFYFEPLPPMEEPAPEPVPMPKLSYEQQIINRIRSIYSVDDELAVLRQRDSKPEEFQQYFDFIEQVKAEVKAEMETEV